MENKKIIDIDEYRSNKETQINDLIKDSTYDELSKYITMLPSTHDSDDTLYYWGISYINEFYKRVAKLSDYSDEETEKLKHDIYSLFLSTNHKNITFSYNEFITFSKLLNVTFTDYNPKKERENDKNPYKSGDEEIDYIVNKVVYMSNHSAKPHAYEVTRFKLDLLLNILNYRRSSIIKRDIEKIDLEDDLIVNTLSKDLLNRIKERKEYLFTNGR